MEERLNPLSRPPGTASPGAGGAGEALDVRGHPSFVSSPWSLPELCRKFLCFSVEFTLSVWTNLLITIKGKEKVLPERIRSAALLPRNNAALNNPNKVPASSFTSLGGSGTSKSADTLV